MIPSLWEYTVNSTQESHRHWVTTRILSDATEEYMSFLVPEAAHQFMWNLY